MKKKRNRKPDFKKVRAERAGRQAGGNRPLSDLNGLLKELLALYHIDVLKGGKRHKLFAMDFLNSHHHTDRRDAAGMNEHRKNLGILRNLLGTREDLLVRFATAHALDDNSIKDMLHLYYTADAPPPGQGKPVPGTSPARHNESLSLGCCLDDDQLSLIADCANEARVFVETVDAGTLRSLLEGKLTAPLHSRNNRCLAFFFDQLCQNGAILPQWQRLLENAGSILGPRDGEPMRHEQFSNALTHAKSKMNSMMRKLRDGIGKATELPTNDGTAS